MIPDIKKESDLAKVFSFCSPIKRDTEGELSPARAGWTGLDPFRFFTGTVGTLQQKTKTLNLELSSSKDVSKTNTH